MLINKITQNEFSERKFEELATTPSQQKTNFVFKASLDKIPLNISAERALKLFLQKFHLDPLEKLNQPLFTLCATVFKNFDHIKGIVIEQTLLSVDKSP